MLRHPKSKQAASSAATLKPHSQPSTKPKALAPINAIAHLIEPGQETLKKGVDKIPTALEQYDKLPDAAHVRMPVVAALNGVGPATIWRWVKSGRLPAPVKLGPNTTAWNVGALRRVSAAVVRGGD